MNSFWVLTRSSLSLDSGEVLWEGMTQRVAIKPNQSYLIIKQINHFDHKGSWPPWLQSIKTWQFAIKSQEGHKNQCLWMSQRRFTEVYSMDLPKVARVQSSNPCCLHALQESQERKCKSHVVPKKSYEWQISSDVNLQILGLHFMPINWTLLPLLAIPHPFSTQGTEEYFKNVIRSCCSLLTPI